MSRREFHYKLRHSTFHYRSYGFDITRNLATFNDLPNELLLNIIEYFKHSPHTLKRLRQVSRSLSSFATLILFRQGYHTTLQNRKRYRSTLTGADFLKCKTLPPLLPNIPKALVLTVRDNVPLAWKQGFWIRSAESKDAKRLIEQVKHMDEITVRFCWGIDKELHMLTGHWRVSDVKPYGIIRMLQRAEALTQLHLEFAERMRGSIDEIARKCYWPGLRTLDVVSVAPDSGIGNMFVMNEGELRHARIVIDLDPEYQGRNMLWPTDKAMTLIKSLRRDHRKKSGEVHEGGVGEIVRYKKLQVIALEGFDKRFKWGRNQSPEGCVDREVIGGKVTKFTGPDVADHLIWEKE